jgi:16S rRNA (cytosine967-C5)-methyltransferase
VERVGWRLAVKILSENNRPVQTVLHVNAGLTSAERVARDLMKEGLDTEPCLFMPNALRLRSGRLRASGLPDRGDFWVQDEAAQLVTAMLGSPSGPRIADLCAAPGGKTMQLAEALPEDGFLVAADRHFGRLERLRANAARAGMMPLPLVNADMASGLAPFRPVFDQVLVDAPCSGTGTLRRHPEIRWRLQEESLKLFAANQAAILERASSVVARGGGLLYAVCSMEPEEGEGVVKAFLESHADFSLADPRPALPETARRLVDGDGFLRTSTADGGLDGFFGALLARSG